MCAALARMSTRTFDSTTRTGQHGREEVLTSHPAREMSVS